MSKLGEITDRILEQLSEKEKLSVNELEKLTDTAILDFMKHFELIELKNEDVRITESGIELLKIN